MRNRTELVTTTLPGSENEEDASDLEDSEEDWKPAEKKVSFKNALRGFTTIWTMVVCVLFFCVSARHCDALRSSIKLSNTKRCYSRTKYSIWILERKKYFFSLEWQINLLFNGKTLVCRTLCHLHHFGVVLIDFIADWHKNNSNRDLLFMIFFKHFSCRRVLLEKHQKQVQNQLPNVRALELVPVLKAKKLPPKKQRKKNQTRKMTMTRRITKKMKMKWTMMKRTKQQLMEKAKKRYPKF